MTTQMCINRLPLNRDVQDVIKSFVFYDMKTWETIKKVKIQKKEIVYMFENAAVSRKNDGLQDFEQESDLDSEHWVFWLGGNENQFQACNCSKCGNYNAEYAYDYMPQNILCNCGENYNDVHLDNHGFHNNPPSEDDDQQDDTEEESYDGDEPDIDRYEYFEQYYNDSDLEDELDEQEARITRTRMQAIQEQNEWDSETEENPIELMRRRQIRRMAELEGEEYYYRYFRHLP